MNNSGSRDPVEVPEPQAAGRRRASLLLIALLAIGALLAAYIGANVIGVLYGIIAPPMPPSLGGLTEKNYSSAAYGVDSWLYAADRDGCTIAAEYEVYGVCRYAPLSCGAMREDMGANNIQRQVIAQCNGQQDFSIFTMQWNATIFALLDGTSEVDLDREVFWIGTGRQ